MNIISEIRLLIRVNKIIKENFEGKSMKNLASNWKTTLAGVINLIVLIGSTTGYLTVAQATSIAGVATSFGLLAAKDGNVTGGTKQQ